MEATPEPLWSAITLAVGGPELKAGGEAAWQGLKTLFSREALQGLSADNVLPRALSAAEMRTAIAEADLPPHGSPLPDVSGQPVPGTHPGPPPVVEHTPHPGGGEIPAEHAPAGPHVPVVPDNPRAPVPPNAPPPPLPPEHELFHGYHPVEPGPQFTEADGSLSYPDDTLVTKPYAVPGTVIPDELLSQAQFSAVSAVLSVPTWPPRERHLLNCHSRQTVLLSPILNTSWATHRSYLPAGTSSNLK